MLPSELIAPIFALGGVCLIFSASVFHYFKDRVEKECNDRSSHFFTININEEILKLIRDGLMSEEIIHDLGSGLLKIFTPKSRFKNIITLIPLSGLLFIIASILSSISFWNTQFFMYYILIINWFTDGIFVIANFSLGYGIYNYIILSRDLS